MPEYQITTEHPLRKFREIYAPCGREAELEVLARDPGLQVADVCRIPGKLDQMKRDELREGMSPFQMHVTGEP